jgi:DNA helicase-4
MADYTLGGETVKSNGEKFIADFLFEHGIAHKYEKVWSWDKQDRLHGTAYRPDFSIIGDGRDVILEHWAIDPDDSSAQVPSWWETSTQNYLDQIKAKREFWAKRGVALLETHSGMLAGGRVEFEASLQALLEHAGIRCQKLGHDELVQRVAEAPRTVSRMAELFLQFISRAKKRGWTVDDMARIVREDPDPEPRNRAFHELALHAYAAYERQLIEQSAMDFDDLLISAAECVREGGGAARLQLDKSDSIAIRDLRWILIDEFQDFSELYYKLITAILEANPTVRLVAVGDDWQAINGFAGAQLTFFDHFRDYFPSAGLAIISTNRRSGRAIVDAGNQLMEGRGESAFAHHRFDGDLDVLAIDKIWPEDGSIYLEAATSVRDDGRKSINWELARALKACADYIAKSVYPDTTQSSRWMPSVLLLARTGRAYGATLAEFGSRLERVLREHPDLQLLANDFAVGKRASDLDAGTALIEVMTAHKAKGKEADTVIVLEGVRGQFPKVHADNQLFGPFGVTVEDVLAEERRLFYVAATRAEHRLMFLTETAKESPYIEAMQVSHLAGMHARSVDVQLSAEAQALKAYLNRIDRKSLIRQNVSQHAGCVWERMAALGAPEVGYSISQDLCAELAWPQHNPPVAILSGRHRAQAARWRLAGWEVH